MLFFKFVRDFPVGDSALKQMEMGKFDEQVAFIFLFQITLFMIFFNRDQRFKI